MWSYTGKPYRAFVPAPATASFDTSAPVNDAESQAAAQAHAQAQAVALMQAAGVVPGMLAYPHPTAMQQGPSSSASSSQQQHPQPPAGSQPGVDPSGMRSPPPPQPGGFMPMPYGAPQFRYAVRSCQRWRKLSRRSSLTLCKQASRCRSRLSSISCPMRCRLAPCRVRTSRCSRC